MGEKGAIEATLHPEDEEFKLFALFKDLGVPLEVGKAKFLKKRKRPDALNQQVGMECISMGMYS